MTLNSPFSENSSSANPWAFRTSGTYCSRIITMRPLHGFFPPPSGSPEPLYGASSDDVWDGDSGHLAPSQLSFTPRLDDSSITEHSVPRHPGPVSPVSFVVLIYLLLISCHSHSNMARSSLTESLGCAASCLKGHSRIHLHRVSGG
jgi:hypothetical protein